MGGGLGLSVGIRIGIGFRKRRFLHTTAPESSFTWYERFRGFPTTFPNLDHFLVLLSWMATRWPWVSSGRRLAFSRDS